MEYNTASFFRLSPGVGFLYIVSQGKPLQVFQAVFLAVGVPVVRGIFAGFRCSQERQAHKPVNVLFFPVYTDLLVSVPVVKGFQDPGFILTQRFYTPFITNEILPTRAGNRLPFFAGKILGAVLGKLGVEYLSINPLQPYLPAFSGAIIQQKGVGLAGYWRDFLACPGFLYHALAVDLIKRKGLDLKKSIVFHPIIPPTSWQ